MPRKLVGATLLDSPPPAEETPISGGKRIVGAQITGEPIDYESKKFEMGPQLKGPKTTIQKIDEKMMDFLPIALGSLGGMAGGPLGAAGGAGLGAGIRNIGNPDPVSAAEDIGTQAAVQGVTEGATPYISKALSKVKNGLTEKMVRMFSSHVPEETRAATDLGVPLSVGQATDSIIPKFLERTLTSDAKRTALADEQKKALEGIEGNLRVRFTGASGKAESPAEYFGKPTQEIIKANIKDTSNATDQLFNKVKFDAKANSMDVPIKVGETPAGHGPNGEFYPATPKFENRRVEGAIPIGEDTRRFASNLSPRLKQLAQDLPDIAPEKADYLKFSRSLDEIANGVGGSGVQPWEMIKELRSTINKGAGSAIDKTRLEGGMSKIAELLGRDVENGVAGWETNSPGALTRLKAANASHALEKQIFTDRVKGVSVAPFGSSPDASKTFDELLRTPEAAQEMMKALGSPDKQRVAKGYFFEHALEKAKSNPDAALDILDHPSYKSVFSQSDRSDLTNFFRTIKRVAPDESKWGQASVWIKGITIGLAATKGAYDYATGDGDIPPSALEGAALLFGAKQFGEKVLLNPKYARTAARLATLAPDSGEATFLRKSILTGLRGVQGLIELKNGEKRDFTVTKEGKIKVGNSVAGSED